MPCLRGYPQDVPNSEPHPVVYERHRLNDHRADRMEMELAFGRLLCRNPIPVGGGFFLDQWMDQRWLVGRRKCCFDSCRLFHRREGYHEDLGLTAASGGPQSGAIWTQKCRGGPFHGLFVRLLAEFDSRDVLLLGKLRGPVLARCAPIPCSSQC